MATVNKKSPTNMDIHPLLANRWSPRIFDPKAKIEIDDLAAILEAARVAPSAFNEQPWRYVVGRRGDTNFQNILAGLSEFNQAWAKNVSALILACALPRRANGDLIKTYQYDLGLSVSQATFEAHHRGFFTHHMSGFDANTMRESFSLGELEPTVVLAIGKQGDFESHSEQAKERESSISIRKDLGEILIESSFTL